MCAGVVRIRLESINRLVNDFLLFCVHTIFLPGKSGYGKSVLQCCMMFIEQRDCAKHRLLQEIPDAQHVKE